MIVDPSRLPPREQGGHCSGVRADDPTTTTLAPVATLTKFDGGAFDLFSIYLNTVDKRSHFWSSDEIN